ncbi:hypothetical protein SDC9_191751 [bioreactor metagenome]|uniref:Uncharacterized protein n=1 Tax=bioreactor metagenome TaxID=1076179 RepID=A0A645HZ50_9ZZZZ
MNMPDAGFANRIACNAIPNRRADDDLFLFLQLTQAARNHHRVGSARGMMRMVFDGPNREDERNLAILCILQLVVIQIDQLHIVVPL